jgi:hypothetical protein
MSKDGKPHGRYAAHATVCGSASRRCGIHIIWHRIGPERADSAPADNALRFGPNSARNRNTSLIRRISALGLGTTEAAPFPWSV